MEENSRYVAGIDVGTGSVRVVVSSLNAEGQTSIVGFSEQQNSGMRKGSVVTLSSPAQTMDRALAEVEPMSGYEINAATISINGDVRSCRIEGMIGMESADHEITHDDLDRLETIALQGNNLQNQKILDVIPLNYTLDSQTGVKDPLGMRGSRMELSALAISTLSPNFDNLCRSAEMANVEPRNVIPSVMAAGRAVLTNSQKENGVAVLDIGYATTGLAIYEEDELQYITTIPIGSHNITNDLAIILKVDTEVAEAIKLRFANCDFVESDNENIVKLKYKGTDYEFSRAEIDETVKARLDEILANVEDKLRDAKYYQKLPEGIMITGGGANLRAIDRYVGEYLQTSAKIGAPENLTGVSDKIKGRPEYASAVGLMLIASDFEQMGQGGVMSAKKHKKSSKSGGFLKKILSKF